jgi:hypothetical protein
VYFTCTFLTLWPWQDSPTKCRSKTSQHKKHLQTRCQKKKCRKGQNVKWKKRQLGQKVEDEGDDWDKTSKSKKIL